jgi:tetratricopeptide (TPR) repeat protein
MEFCVLLDSDVASGVVFQISNDKLNTTLREVIDRFAERVRSANLPDFDPTRYHLYICDQSDPFNHPPPHELESIDTKISDLGLSAFDLIFGHKPPSVTPLRSTAQSRRPLAFELDSKLQEAADDLAECDYLSAFKVLKKVTDGNQSDPRPFLLLVKIYLRLKLYQLARFLISKVANRFSDDQQILFYNGLVHYKCGSYSRAIELLQTLRDRQQPRVLITMAKCLFRLKCLAESKETIQDLVTKSPANRSAVYLLARLFVLEGKLIDGIRLFVETDICSPSCKHLCRFIGRDICTPHALAVFMGECSDCFRDSSFVFFVAKSLFDFGECDASRSFFYRAFLMAPASSAIALGLLQLEIVRRSRVCALIEIVDTHLASAKEPTFRPVRSIGSLIGANPSPDWSRRGAVFERSAPLPVVFSAQQKVHTTEELEAVSILTRLQIYLFSNGYISACRSIADVVVPPLAEFSFDRSIVRVEVLLALLIWSQLPAVARPLKCTSRFLFVIGGNSIVRFAYHEFNFRGQDLVIRPIIIPGLKFGSFAKPSPEAAAFDRAFAEVPPGSCVMTCFGEEDCETFCGHLRKAPMRLEIIADLVSGAVEAFANKIRRMAKFRVLVHPVPPLPAAIFREVGLFNITLRTAICDFQVRYQHLEFLDVAPLLVDEAAACPRPEISIDGVTLAPEYLTSLEEYINARAPLDREGPPVGFVTLDMQ